MYPYKQLTVAPQQELKRGFLHEIFIELSQGGEVVHRQPCFINNLGEVEARIRISDGVYQVEWFIDGDSQGVSTEHITAPAFAPKPKVSPVNDRQFVHEGEVWKPITFNGNYNNNDFRGQWSLDLYRDTASQLKDVFGDSLSPVFRFNLSGNFALLFVDKEGEINHQAAQRTEDVLNTLYEEGVSAWMTTSHRGGTKNMPLAWEGSMEEGFEVVWPDSPYNKANGGSFEHPREFVTTEKGKELFASLDRYLTARFAAYPNLVVQELCAEGYLWGWDAATMRHWNNERIRAIKAMDPYGTMIVTGDGGEFYADEADFFSWHCHPNPAGRKLSSELEDRDNAYAVANHYGHNHTPYMALTDEQSVSCGALGYGQYFDKKGVPRENPDGSRNTTHYRRRHFATVHLAMENVFALANGVGGPWDSTGTAPYFGIDAYKGVALAAELLPDSASVRDRVSTIVDAGRIALAGVMVSDEFLGYFYDPEDANYMEVPNANVHPQRSLEYPLQFSDSGSYELMAYDARSAMFQGSKVFRNTSRVRIKGKFTSSVLIHVRKL